MKHLFIGAAIILSACATVQDSTYSYSSAEGTALLITHHQNTRTTLLPVDLETNMVNGEPLVIGGEFVTMIDYSNERLTEYHKNDLGWHNSSNEFTGFEVNKVSPGKYAVIGTVSSGYLAGVTYTTQGCFIDNALIIDLQPNQPNYLERPTKMKMRQQYGDKVDTMKDPNSIAIQTKHELERVNFILEEYPNIDGKAKHAPVIAAANFQKANTSSGCDYGSTFEIIQ